MKNGEKIKEVYRMLHHNICSVLEEADGKGVFEDHPWEKEVGSGLTCVMEGGNIIEKAGVNFSYVTGPVTETMKSLFHQEAETFLATGISSIIHASNPFVPTIHMNVRYFALDDKAEWFGGGIDLTPMYVDPEEAAWFHNEIKAVCDKYNPRYYPDFKKWADDYFFLPHRDETRGIGGIFFDHQSPDQNNDLDDWLKFTSDLAKLYPHMYAELMAKDGSKPFGAEQKKWQKLRRGRYVEFNLMYDRGTRFGLASQGNIESILVSMPPEVDWDFNVQLQPGSEEEKTVGFLKKGIEWTNLKT
ncbi:oxygen-dependent coproporphyrinogen oxidase [Saccharicrinis sp. FJH62]|uniref:oxygen-dependent coproporphyrinogen oxidase n=1 Tax=Saccharicrinis sp. FJH62 TaxID=3344657 RepID=UPI0035D41258